MVETPQLLWNSSRNAAPEISVLVRSLNEIHCLTEFWRQLEEQTYFHQAEVLFLDSGSTDDTLGFLQTKPCAVYRISTKSFNFGRSTNQLMELSRAPRAMFLSAHVLLHDPETLATVVSLLDPHDCGAAYLRQVPNGVFGYNEYDVAYLKHRFPAGECAKLVRKPGGFSNAASALTRSAWERHRFPEIHGSEDFVWAQEHLRRGGKLWYLPHLRVLHSHDESASAVYQRVRLNVDARGLSRSYGRAAYFFGGVFVSMMREGAWPMEAWRYASSHARAYL